MEKIIHLLVSGIVIGCIYGLLALSYSLIYKSSGLMSYMQGDVMTIGAYMGLTLYGILGFPFWLSLSLTAAAAFFFGAIVEKSVVRPLLRKKAPTGYIVLATIAAAIIIQNGSTLIWGTLPLYFPPIFSIGTVRVFGVGIQPESIMCVAVSILLMLALHLFMNKTRIGTSMRASAMDPLAAEACGIDTSLGNGIAWGISAGIASAAGMLIGPLYGVYSLLGATLGRKGFTGAVAGGFGNLYGAILGGAALGIAENLAGGYISSSFKNLIAYLLLLCFLLLRPSGIFNEKTIHEV